MIKAKSLVRFAKIGLNGYKMKNVGIMAAGSKQDIYLRYLIFCGRLTARKTKLLLRPT